MLSILIPTYNYSVYDLVERLHGEALSLGVDFEIIVLDDASEIEIERNKHIDELPKCSYVKLTSNLGRTAARSELAKRARFDWLLFLDADTLPKSEAFLDEYLASLEGADVVFGGVAYSENPPEKDRMLRWTYGHAREAKSVQKRMKSPWFIISQNLCIRKATFQDANVVNENYYGLDNLFSDQLFRNKATIKHIDNPVYHLGLESNDKFITKALKAVETTVIFEKRGMMHDNLRPLQKAYKKLKRLGMIAAFKFVISRFKKSMERNFHSGKPNLFWFDLYRLNHYIELKQNNA